MDIRPTRSYQGPSIPASNHRSDSSGQPNSHALQPDHLFDADTNYASFAEPPKKLRKTQAHIDKSKGIGTNTPGARAADSSYATAAPQIEDVSNIPYPVHQTRVEPPDPTVLRAPPRESLKNDLSLAGVPSPPKEAPQHPSGRNDYFPWERNHAEDVLNESITRNGYFEKASSSSAELVSARPSIISCIRNKPACDALSDLMVACLQRRQQLCSVSTRNTFKPPPRVTLTDNKREAWLKDLADGAIPLRRLSRTIPHGIRGKGLLDHCLAKHVPTWRAIWLVKCVGSNEIRAYRRKGAGPQSFGAGGELKWLKDWTDSVLDFVASLTNVADPMKPTGREHITYALSLISHIYHEHLLDQDLFNRSISKKLGSLSTTDYTAFCLWTSVIGQYMTDLLKCRQRGCELVKCLLAALENMQNASTSKMQLAAIGSKCRKLLITILSNQPSNFVLPECWTKWSSLVRSLINADDFQMLGLFDDLERRNALLSSGLATFESSVTPSVPSAEAQLDVFDATPDPDAFMLSLQRLASDSSELVKLPINWCTSYKRNGVASIYLVARVIRLISKKLAYSCQDDLCRLLAATDSKNQLQARRLYMLTSELVRSHHFSVSKYLHFLLARGVSAVSKIQIAFLSFIPRHALSTEVLNLASNMCTSIKCSPISDKEEVEFQVAAMQLAISKCRPNNGLTPKDHSHISSLDSGTKSAIALRLRKDIVNKRAEQSYPSPDDHDSMDLDAGSLQSRLPATLSTFELLQDFPTLADVLLLFIPSATLDSLSILALCVKCHHQNFLAMSALQRLFAELLKRYAVLYSEGIRERGLTKSMMDVAILLPNARQTLSVLEGHLNTLGSDHTEIACSPLSDNMLDAIQSQEVRSLEDLENLLQSGNVIGEDLLAKMLAFLVGVLDSSQADPELMSNLLKLLRRLADSDRTCFNSFVAKYLHSTLTSGNASRARKSLPWIIAGELCPVDELVASCLRLSADASKKDMACRMAFNLTISLAAAPTVDLCNCVRYYYAFTIMQKDLFENKRDKLARLAELALQTTVPKPGTGSVATKTQNLSTDLEDIMLGILCDSPRRLDLQFEDSLMQLHAAGAPIEDMLCRMIKLHSGSQEVRQASFAPMTLLHKVSEVVRPETVAPCRLLAQIELDKLERSSAPAETLEKAASSFVTENSVWRRMSCWAELARNLSSNFTSTLHEAALNEVVKSIQPVLERTECSGDALQQFETSLSAVQDSIPLLAATQSKVTVSCLLKSIDSLSDMLRLAMATINPETSNSKMHIELSDNDSDTLDKAVYVLLHLLAAHSRPAHLSVLPADQVINLITVLSKLYIDGSDVCILADSTTTLLLDILLTLTRSLAEEGRAKCFSQVQSSCGSLPQEIQAILGSSVPKDEYNGFLLEIPDEYDGIDSPSDMPRSVITKTKPFNIDAWEMLQDTTPLAGPNDSCLSLSLFGARKSIF